MIMKILHEYGIYHNNIKRALFDNFLLQPGHEHYLQDFLIFCCVEDKGKLNRIIRAFEFTLTGGMTYAQLFRVDKEWIGFYAENAWECGIPKATDNRLGVSSDAVNAIMRNKHKGGLEDAIITTITTKQNAVGF
jgi:hypothetical protein